MASASFIFRGDVIAMAVDMQNGMSLNQALPVRGCVKYVEF